jgi:hypothetical protein
MSKLPDMILSSTRRMSPENVVSKSSPPKRVSPSKDRGTKRFGSIQMDWENKAHLTQSQINQIDKYIMEAITYYCDLLKTSSYRLLLEHLHEEQILDANLNKETYMFLFYVDAKEGNGGVANPNRFTMFACPVGAREQPTAPWIAIHEMHHTFGSHTENDIGSDIAYFSYVLDEHFDNPLFATDVKNDIFSQVLTLLNHRHDKGKYYTELRHSHKFLYNKFRSKYTSILKREKNYDKLLKILTDVFDSC